MKLISRSILVIALVTGLFFVGSVSGEWSADPTLRTPVSTADHRQYFPRLVQVEGGFVVTWQDTRRDNTHVDVYAQKIGLNGEMLWPDNGRVIAAGPESSLEYHIQLNAGLVHDGNGGALVGWNDANDPLYLQAFVTRASAGAAVSWGNPGERIQASDTAVPMIANPTRGANRLPEQWGMVADSENGIFVPLGSGLGRVSSSGSVRTHWYSDPSDYRVLGQRVPLVPVLESGERDAVIAIWNQGNTYFSDGIRARKLVDPESSWPASPDTFSIPWGTKAVFEPDYSVSVCNVAAVPDGSGGAIIVWIDNRVRTETSHYRVYAQRINSSGGLMWPQGGVEVSADIMTYTCYWWSTLFAVADGEGGVVIAWNEGQYTQRVQRLAADGSAYWTAGGLIVDAQTEDPYYNLTTHGLVRATDGNFIVLYHHEENAKLITQKLDGVSGTPLWGDGQVVLNACFYPYNAGNAPMVSDGHAGAVVAWESCDGNIYAHRVVEESAVSLMNAGMNDAWYNPKTDGQGFFINIFPNINAVSLAWFTYDTELPPLDAIAHLGDPGHRWLTALGPIEGNQSLMNIELTSGGIFDTATTIIRTDPPGSDGTLQLTFHTCNSGTIEYDIPSINQSGTVPIRRVANDNIALCEALNTD